MFQNEFSKKITESLFVSLNNDKDTAYLNMTLEGINFILEKFNQFDEKKEIVFNKEVLDNANIKNAYPLYKLVFKFWNLDENCIVANVSKVEPELHIFGSSSGMKEFESRLLSLKDCLEQNITDDISYMIPEWGGECLLYREILKDSHIVSHLRLYGAI